VFAFKRENEDPTRMFAGEGDPFRTNRRFHLLSRDMPAKRLSTAFDSVTLYGFDPDERPDIYGKVGNSGVSIATFDDMKVLYAGFDLCDPATSVSMTINGPAPTILAMFFNTAIDQQLDKFRKDNGREPTEDETAKIRAWTLSSVRGTVQADILKEDQGQNTCIFSTEFSLKVMGDIQEHFIHHQVKNFYSVSISGYHIAEAGANPISQLAFTLANGFTFVEAYLARGMHIDDFAPNLSFFFSYGMDPEYAVLGRVARRIWAVAMRERYGANERSQKLKFHSQTSGRSLHAQEIAFNDIRTTLQALISTYDNTNSLHTNAYDEAITTPTEESVRRAMAIQLIINKEWGLAKNENPNQGAFVIDELTDLVEEAVLKEFEAISARGGVLGAMETGYQRGKIQEESMVYEHKKHDGSYPIVGVNTFRNPHGDPVPAKLELIRSSDEEKKSQLQRLRDFQARHAAEAPAMLERLGQAVMRDENVFAVLMDAVRVCSLGQITQALFEVGGQYRRNM
jgi:methylmalonyl-CoA mutase